MGRKSKYEPAFADTLLEMMADGLSFEACCGHFKVCRDTGYEWIKRYEEFAEAKAIGEAMGQLYWERVAQANILCDKETKFNATVFIFTMKNRFGWRDKKEISGEVGVNMGLDKLYQDMNVNQIETKIGELLARLPKGAQL